jgi:hypothetical protein
VAYSLDTGYLPKSPACQSLSSSSTSRAMRHRSATTSGASCAYLFNAAITIRKPWSLFLANRHISLWSAAMPQRSVLSMMGAALDSSTIKSRVYLRSVLCCSQKKKTRKRGMIGTKAAVISWRTPDSDSRIWRRVVESDSAALGTTNETSFVMVCAKRALGDPW